MIDWLIPLANLAFTVAVPLAVVGGSAVLISKTEIGRALIDRVRSGQADSARVKQLAAELDAVRDELVDVQERLDATELMLQSDRKPPRQIDGGFGDA